MITKDELEALLAAALARAGETEAELYAHVARRGFARFMNGDLGQHMLLEEPRVHARVAKGRRVAEACTSELDEEAIADALHGAAATASDVPEDPSFPGFARTGEPALDLAERWAEPTARISPEARTDKLEPVLARIRAAGLFATGALDATAHVEAVATTGGIRRSHAGTIAAFRVWALESSGAGGASGHGHATHVNVDRLDLEGEAERAVADALRSKDPLALDPGDYDVVLEPRAVAELFEWLGMIAFSARELHQGSSALAGRFGERISGDFLSVSEDPTGPLALAGPFDREGTTRRKVPLIERGTARGVLYDRAWGGRLGHASTGSAAIPAFGEAGPTASALVVGGGEAASSDELIGGIERGLLIRRLHYVNGMLEPRRAVMTGLTRDGTFLVEKGRVVRAVGNLRFTDSLLEAFERVDGVTRERTLVPTWWSDAGSVAAPAVRIRRLRFTGGSQKSVEIG